ncbi:MAG TPA: hypothetical protein VLO13_05005, partial [Halomonas sp.]|nr:hypothetical protein [Halomonas sp.]
YGVYVGHGSKIGAGLKFPHPTTIVIGRHVIIGNNARIFQQVTIGGLPKGRTGLLVRMGDNVTVFHGAKFIGTGCVGSNVVVGANGVVTKPFGDNVVLAGVPARVIRSLDVDISARQI